MFIKIPITLFFLVALSFSACFNPTQPVGKCTLCTPLDVLISGNCYPKMRGCLRYGQGPICIQCQNGYVLTNNTCIRQAVFFNRSKDDIHVFNQTRLQTLKLEQIRNRLGQKYGTYTSIAHQYYILKYTQLLNATIRNVDRLHTKIGVFLIIEYQLNNTDKYHAVSFINNLEQVSEWSFSILSKDRIDPITADKLVRTALAPQLKDYFIYQFTRQTEIYIINYMTNQFKIMRVLVNINDLNNPRLSTKLTIKELSLETLAKQLINSEYPNLNNSQIIQVRKMNDFFIMKLSNLITISYQFRNFIFKINKPFDSSLENFGGSYLLPNNSGFVNFTDFSDIAFKISVQYTAKQFPEVVGASVTRAQKKIDNGQLFLFNLRKTIPEKASLNQYEFKIWFNPQNIARIIWGKKNKQFIYHTNYNYNDDEQFFLSYPVVQKQSKVLNIPIIYSVTFKKTENKLYYKVIYSERQFTEIYNDQNQPKLISYFIDGQNILSSLAEQKAMAEKRSNSLLLTFIKGVQSNAESAKIKQIIYNVPSQYIVTVVSSSGTYNAVIEDKGQLVLNQYNKLSDVTCFDMKQLDVIKSSEIKAIDEFLKSNYDIQDLNIQLVQIHVKLESHIYRLLYSNPKIKQVEFYIQEDKQTANVIKASFINSAFEIVQPVQTNQQYGRIILALNGTDFLGDKAPFFVQSNSSFIKAYYNDDRNTIEIMYDKKSKQILPQVIYTRSYLLIPEGFSMENLKIPGTSTADQTRMITRIYQQALKRFSIVIKDSSLTFVDKINSTYNLMFKNQYGYQKMQAKIDEKGTITLGRLVITGYREGDFSNCKKYNKEGKCLSCEIERQIQYQGGCHKKIEGCLIQAGPNCVKCNANFIKSSYKCYKDCSLFFK